MSSESEAERLHLEGLDEATERERWEEHHAMTADDLTRLRAVAIEAAKYKRGDRSMLAGEAFSAWANQVDPPTVVALIDRVERAERERDEAFDKGATAEANDWRAERAKYDYEILGNHDADFLQLQADFDAQNDALSAARAELAALRAAVDGLADRWESEDQQCLNPQMEVMWPSDELRGLLTEGADDGQ